MKKISKTLIILFGMLSAAQAQKTDSLILLATSVSDIAVDKLGNYYYTDHSINLHKIDNYAKRTFNYSSQRNGKINSIDVKNPLQVLVFYSDFQTLKFLDGNLSEINTYSIRDNYQEGIIRLVCASNNNGFWMYDESNRKLIKVGDNFRAGFTSGDLFQVLGSKIIPNRMSEYGDELFINDPSKGIYVFDLFGGYKRRLPIKDVQWFGFEKDYLIYYTGQALHSYHLPSTRDELIWESGGGSVRKLIPYADRYLSVSGDSLYVKYSSSLE